MHDRRRIDVDRRAAVGGLTGEVQRPARGRVERVEPLQPSDPMIMAGANRALAYHLAPVGRSVDVPDEDRRHEQRHRRRERGRREQAERGAVCLDIGVDPGDEPPPEQPAGDQVEHVQHQDRGVRHDANQAAEQAPDQLIRDPQRDHEPGDDDHRAPVEIRVRFDLEQGERHQRHPCGREHPGPDGAGARRIVALEAEDVPRSLVGPAGADHQPCDAERDADHHQGVDRAGVGAFGETDSTGLDPQCHGPEHQRHPYADQQVTGDSCADHRRRFERGRCPDRDRPAADVLAPCVELLLLAAASIGVARRQARCLGGVGLVLLRHGLSKLILSGETARTRADRPADAVGDRWRSGSTLRDLTLIRPRRVVSISSRRDTRPPRRRAPGALGHRAIR